MIKKITKAGSSHAHILVSAPMQRARLKPGDAVKVEVPAGGAVTLPAAQRSTLEPEAAAQTARRLIGKNNELFRRLAQ